MNMIIERGMIFLAENKNSVGSEIQKRRPYVIIQNDRGNLLSSTVLCCPVTSNNNKGNIETQVFIKGNSNNGGIEGYILCEQIFTYDKSRLNTYLGKLSENEIKMVDKALAYSIDLSHHKPQEELPEKKTKDLMIDRHSFLKNEMMELEKELCAMKIKIEEYKQEFAFLDSYVNFKPILPTKDDLMELINEKKENQIVVQKEESKEKIKKTNEIANVKTEAITISSNLNLVTAEIYNCLKNGITKTCEMTKHIESTYAVDNKKAQKSVANALQFLKINNKARPTSKGIWEIIE